MSIDRNCLSYWFPKLLAAGLPVPRTRIVTTSVELTSVLDGQSPEGFTELIELLRVSAREISPAGPWFLRTGQGSGKHEWSRTCFVTDISKLSHHVGALVYWSHTVDFFGQRPGWQHFADAPDVVREAVLPRYGDMPLVTEARCFVEGGRICGHPYWPEKSILEGLPIDHEHGREVRRKLLEGGTISGLLEEGSAFSKATRDQAKGLYDAQLLGLGGFRIVEDLAGQVAAAFAGDGAWSVDLLETANGWFVTDMAEAGRSFHFEGCPNATRAWEAPK